MVITPVFVNISIPGWTTTLEGKVQVCWIKTPVLAQGQSRRRGRGLGSGRIYRRRRIISCKNLAHEHFQSSQRVQNHV